MDWFGAVIDPANRADAGPAKSSADGLRVAAALGLEPLALEGGLFRRTYSSDTVTVIYYLVAGQDFSAMHRLRTADELFLFHAGAPLRMLLLGGLGGLSEDPSQGSDGLGAGGSHGSDGWGGRDLLLGPDPIAGQLPQVLVPGGVWQGASSTGGWSLVSTMVTPGFRWEDFELADRPTLISAFPHWSARVAALTR